MRMVLYKLKFSVLQNLVESLSFFPVQLTAAE